MQNFHQFEANYFLQSFLSWFRSSNILDGYTGIVFSVVVAGTGCILLVIIRKFLLLRFHLQQKYTLLELTPPVVTEKQSYTTQQLFSLIHALGSQRSFIHRLVGYTSSVSLEIASTKELGIRYLARVLSKETNTFKKSLLSYMPQLSVKTIEDYMQTSLTAKQKILEFKLSHHFAFPLKKQDELAKHDPIAYITGMMTKLALDELVSFQIVLTPTKSYEARRLSNVILYNGNVIESLEESSGILPALGKAFYTIYSVPFWIISNIATNGNISFPSLVAKKSIRDKTSYEQEVITAIHNKVDQPLFKVNIRLFLAVNESSGISERVRGFISSFATFATHGRQSIVPVRYANIGIIQRCLFILFVKRLPNIFSTSLLSISEVSDIYHFPFTRLTRTEDLVKTHSKELPAPLSLKKSQTLDSVFAKNTYGGSTTDIGLTEDERRRHIYILGATGTGKSTMLLSMIEQDIKHHKGLCVIDPHGDLIEQVVSIIPRERIPDVVYFNPDDISYPMGINLLELTPGLDAENAVREKEFIAESIISIFHKIYSDKYSGPRMEYILRNTIHTAFTVPDATLFTVYKLLINTSYRKGVVRGLTDENLKDFWKYEFAKAGDYQKVKMISPITNKIGRFLFSPTAKRILEQGKSTINFDTILNEGKILLCNLSKGKIGEDNSSVFGVLIMAKIQLAALKRARMKQEDRKDFYLYVDEFQNFATPAFAQILSEARKYKLNAILAHQTTSQIEENSLVNVTLANTGTVICFRTANPEDERMILPQFRPYIEEGEIASLPSYHFYMRLGALNPEEPFSGVTTPVHIEFSQNRINEVIESSRKYYAKKYEAVALIPRQVKNTSSGKVKIVVP